jgi:hypothetical protein
VAVEVRFINGSDSVLLAQCYEENLSKDSRYAYIEVLDFECGKSEIWEIFISELIGIWRKIDGYVYQHW